MFGRRKFLSLPMVVVASVISPLFSRILIQWMGHPSRMTEWASILNSLDTIRIGVVSGKFIFGPPLEEYWTKKLQEEAGKEKDSASS